MRIGTSLIPLLLVASVPVRAEPEHRGHHTLRIVNETDETIYTIRRSAMTEAPIFGSDLLGDDVLEPGAARQFELSEWPGFCRTIFLAETKERVRWTTVVDICRDGVWTIRKTGSGQ